MTSSEPLLYDSEVRCGQVVARMDLEKRQIVTFLPHRVQHRPLTQSNSTQREKLPESLKTRLLKGLKGHLFSMKRIIAHSDLKS